MRLLILEDDVTLGEALADFLRSEGHGVTWCTTLSQCKQAQAIQTFDAWIIDWQLPDGSGIEWLRALRGQHLTTPAVVITARDQLDDRLEGLDTGADDYLVKPFQPEELSARLRAVCRRCGGWSTSWLQAGNVSLDLAARVARLQDKLVPLTHREWVLVESLALRRGRIVSRSVLEDLVVGLDGSLSDNALEVHISAIRRKLGKALIETHRGLGYRMPP